MIIIVNLSISIENFFLLFTLKDYFVIYIFVSFHTDFKNNLFSFLKNTYWDFDRNYVKPIDQLGKNGYPYYDECSTP